MFADFAFQYVQYGFGVRDAVNYNYVPDIIIQPEYNVVRYKSFVNTLGLGLQHSFLNRFWIYFTCSGGYNYFETEYSPTNPTHIGLGGYSQGTFIRPAIAVKLGLSYNVVRKNDN